MYLKTIATIILLLFFNSAYCLKHDSQGLSNKINKNRIPEQKTIVLDNQKIQKTFYYQDSIPGKILIELKDKVTQEILNNRSGIPYFEFVLNNRHISSQNDLWVFNGVDERKMGNAGTEYRLKFEGKKTPVHGLKVVIIQQLFPGSTLMREKLELQSAGKSFTLHKMDGKLHFRFPSYSFLNEKKSAPDLTEIRIAAWEKKPVTFGSPEKGNHMFYPEIIETKQFDGIQTVKGPFSIIETEHISFLTAYEHASQDGLKGMLDEQKSGSGKQINDAMQGTKGKFSFPISDEDFMFLGITNHNLGERIDVSVDIKRGGYLDGEVINNAHPYETVWTATGFFRGKDIEERQKLIGDYLLHQICENPVSRRPEFYYNTWGMQRADKNKPLRDILTYNRIFKEIENAAQLGVDIFVLDDGWENKQGEWFPHTERLNQGLEPIKQKLEEHNLKMGLWFSPMGIDSTSERFKQHPEWVIKDSEGKPILAQWNHPAFDFVGGFYDLFVEDCKKLIDQGCRFMKWDAINTFYSSLPGLEHGTHQYSKEEIRARYEYLLPVYVVRAMKELTDYEPDLIIEVDLTEARRVMTGLAPLSQGKLFWMNNGASWYNDYTAFRTKSMRTIANEFAGIIPLELFTYANYPHDLENKMEYNVHNSLLAGHGFWGDLELMTTEQREWVGSQVAKSKKVLPYLVDTYPVVIGKVGDSPEIYSVVKKEAAAGQIICFSENPGSKEFSTDIHPENFLAVLDHPYVLKNNRLNFSFQFTENESSKAIFILPKEKEDVSVISSTSAISDIFVNEIKLEYRVDTPGEQVVVWSKDRGIPSLQHSPEVQLSVDEKENNYRLIIKTGRNSRLVTIVSGK